MRGPWRRKSAKVLVTGARDRGNGVEGGGKRGNEPTQADARDGSLDLSKDAGLEKADADSVGAGEAVGSGVVEVDGWLGETGKKVGFVIGQEFPMFQAVRVSGEKFQPALDARVVFSDLGDILERCVVGVCEGRVEPGVAAGAFGGPYDATVFEVDMDQGSLVVDG